MHENKDISVEKRGEDQRRIHKERESVVRITPLCHFSKDHKKMVIDDSHRNFMFLGFRSQSSE